MVVLTEQAYRYDVCELRLRVERVVADPRYTDSRMGSHHRSRDHAERPRPSSRRHGPDGALMRSRAEDKACDGRTR